MPCCRREDSVVEIPAPKESKAFFFLTCICVFIYACNIAYEYICKFMFSLLVGVLVFQ